jgi:hypothetical protein
MAGVATVAAACVSYARTPHSAADVAALGCLFLGMVLAERFPVPVEGVDAGGVTLGFVFAVAAIVLFGWQAGVIVAAAARRSASPTTARCSRCRRSRAALRSN